jgi:hypothetical protein
MVQPVNQQKALYNFGPDHCSFSEAGETQSCLFAVHAASTHCMPTDFYLPRFQFVITVMATEDCTPGFQGRNSEL